jgi:hypothetical protein
VKAAVEELVPTAGSGGGRDSCRVSCDAGYIELLQETICFFDEPGWVARFEDDGPGMQIAKEREKGFGCGRVEGCLGRKLEEDWA